LIECYKQIADLRQTLAEIIRLADDLPRGGLREGIQLRAAAARIRTRPNMESKYAKTAH
jgi:hypothetical protein